MSFEKYNESEQQSLSEKQVQWEKKQEEINKITDALGKEIDEGIKETVIAFNLLGIHTRQSCEGRLDEGVAAPWIDILSPESRKLFPKIEELREKLDTLSEEMSGFEEIENEYGRAMEEYDKRNLNELKMHFQFFRNFMSREVYPMREESSFKIQIGLRLKVQIFKKLNRRK